ncbi:MAG: 2-(1,2-epoxy-1,2-dihydrophenyl)acetyl-CoA isomerase [Phycisphaerae bacterium]|nr:2-(1,2-epoxy-1,2-dihydrophenyl)acetyl-CoA isomerase [Phycisphaerae bacterium]|tara:strand:+ start:2097 stop:2906 length:810 start_codon:yes stop_codon:yes gene_type:complete
MTSTTSTYETITLATSDHVSTITINRPDVLNAFNDAFSKEMLDAIKTADRDPETRVIVITGAGRAFSSGQDLGDLKRKYVPGHVPELGDDLRRRYDPMITRIRATGKPVIAAVNGVAAGAGCSLALACDLRIASEHAAFIEVFVNVGLVPDSGSTWTLPRLIGWGRAMEMCMTGRKVKAEEALQIGLVNQVVSADELEAATQKMAHQLASLPGRALALTKRLINESYGRSLEDQLEAEAYAQDTAGKTKDHFEGVTAFLEKRSPTFVGA